MESNCSRRLTLTILPAVAPVFGFGGVVLSAPFLPLFGLLVPFLIAFEASPIAAIGGAVMEGGIPVPVGDPFPGVIAEGCFFGFLGFVLEDGALRAGDADEFGSERIGGGGGIIEGWHGGSG
jgi:hypothetical protein